MGTWTLVRVRDAQRSTACIRAAMVLTWGSVLGSLSFDLFTSNGKKILIAVLWSALWNALQFDCRGRTQYGVRALLWPSTFVGWPILRDTSWIATVLVCTTSIKVILSCPVCLVRAAATAAEKLRNEKDMVNRHVVTPGCAIYIAWTRMTYLIIQFAEHFFINYSSQYFFIISYTHGVLGFWGFGIWLKD